MPVDRGAESVPSQIDRSVTSPGLILVLPGIDGWSLFNRGIAPGLRAGGVAGEIRFYDWTRGFPHMLGNLRDRRLHDEQAALLAEQILRYRRRHPDAPLWLIGHSGGAALLLLTLARLRGSTTVTGAVLLAPAISAEYDVEAPLATTERGIWNFRSWGDLTLGATLLLGNVDGPRSFAAGLRGFMIQDPRPGPQLHDVPWTPAMLRQGHLGGHFGCVNRFFIRRHVAPLLAGDERA